MLVVSHFDVKGTQICHGCIVDRIAEEKVERSLRFDPQTEKKLMDLMVVQNSPVTCEEREQLCTSDPLFVPGNDL